MHKIHILIWNITMDNDKKSVFSKSKTDLLKSAFKKEKEQNYKGAIALLISIPDYQKNKVALLSLARCYTKNKEYPQALNAYLMIPNWKNDKQVLVILGRYYAERKKYKKSLKTFQMILNWRQDKQALLGLARCYQELREYNQAANMYKMVPNWQQDKQVLLGLAHLCKIEKKEDLFINIVNHGLRLYPYEVNFFLLNIDYYFRIGDFNAAHVLLLQAYEKFPNSKPIAFNLVYFYLSQKDKHSALNLKNKLHQTHPSKKIFLTKIDNLFHMQRFDSLFNIDEFSCKPSMIVELPNTIKSIFQYLNDIDSSVLLVGSSLLPLINQNENKKTTNDLDFVFYNDSTIPNLHEKGFFSCPYITGLFQKIDLQNGFKIDMKLCDYADANQRDFTIGALFCNLSGEIIDPTGMGINDAKQKILRTVIDPVLSFQEDPVRVLRAVKKMIQGFEPCPELEKALYNWLPTKKTNKDRMRVVLNTHFNTENVEQYVNTLIKYQLADKLCGIEVLQKFYPFEQVKQQPVLFAYPISPQHKTKSLEDAVTVKKLTDDFAYLNLGL